MQKDLCRISQNGKIIKGASVKSTRCQDMPDQAGISYGTWIRIMIKNSVVAKQVIIGGRLICISAERNMPSDIYCIVACGRNFFSTVVGSVMTNLTRD